MNKDLKDVLLAIVVSAIVLVLIVWGGSVALGSDYRIYRLDHCEVVTCTNLNIEAHHIYPQSKFPELADGQGGTNIISLCRYHHIAWAHGGNSTKYYNIKIRKMVDEYNGGLRKYEDRADTP